VGDNYFVDNLLLTSTDGSCEDLQDWLDVGTDVVAGIEDGAPAAESCEALTAYFDHLESLDSGAERLELNAGSYDLAVGNPDTGTWDGWASLFWGDGDEGEAERWDAENCIYTYAPFDVESTEWDIDDVEITIDRTIAGVTGSLTGTLSSESNSSGTLSVDFSAESCEYTGGAGLLLTL
jgi:hypothetical protein